MFLLGLSFCPMGRGLPDRDAPLDRDPPGQRPPLDGDAHWIENPPWTKTPTGRRCPLVRDPTPDRDPPWTESPLYGKEWAVRILLECIIVFRVDKNL